MNFYKIHGIGLKEIRMNKIKIVHMLCSNSFSGAENVVCQIVNAFKDDARYKFVYASPAVLFIGK